MSNNAYSAVIADLKSKRDALNKMISDLEALSSGGITPETESKQEDSEPAEVLFDEPAKTTQNDFLGKSIPDATVTLLTQERRKMRTKEIAEALKAGGMEFSSGNPTNSVGSILNRRQKQHGDVVSPDRGYWGLKEWYPGRTFGKKAKEDDNKAVMMPGMSSNQTTEPERPSSQAPVFQLHSSERP